MYIYIYKIIIKLCLPFLRLIIISHLFSLFSILFPIHLKHNCKQTCAWLACLQFNSNSFTQRKNTLWPQKCRSLISIRSLTDFHSIGYRQTRKSRGWWNSSPRIGKKKNLSMCMCYNWIQCPLTDTLQQGEYTRPKQKLIETHGWGMGRRKHKRLN